LFCFLAFALSKEAKPFYFIFHFAIGPFYLFLSKGLRNSPLQRLLVTVALQNKKTNTQKK